MENGVIHWIKSSNRVGHLLGGLVLGLFLTFFCALGAAAGMEFKDCHHSKGNAGKPFREWDWGAWDWWDFSLTCLGGLLGGGANAFVLWLLFCR